MLPPLPQFHTVSVEGPKSRISGWPTGTMEPTTGAEEDDGKVDEAGLQAAMLMAKTKNNLARIALSEAG